MIGYQPSRREALACCIAAVASPARAMTRLSDERTARVVDFGARGLGADHDDTESIQRAIDAMAARGGGTVLFDAPKAFYQASRPLTLLPKVSLRGDGSHPEIRSDDARRQLLFVGNFHPAFIERLKFDALSEFDADTRTVRLTDERAAARYKVGDQVLVTNREWGRTGTFRLPRYSWLNSIVGRSGSTLLLREKIDKSLLCQIAPLKEGAGRFGLPLFFHSDGEIAEMKLTSRYHVILDSAALNTRIKNNIVRGRSAIYGNSYQKVTWSGNTFYFSHILSEQSQTSFDNIVENNQFRYTGSSEMSDPKNQYFGMYFQEYARNIVVRDNVFHMGDFSSKNFCISITLAQNITVDRCMFYGKSVPSIIFIGATPEPQFEVFGNFIRNSIFDTGVSSRFAHVDGGLSPSMRGNGIERCAFKGSSAEPDAVRLVRMRGAFSFKGNKLPQPGKCYVMGGSTGITSDSNVAGGRGLSCRSIS